MSNERSVKVDTQKPKENRDSLFWGIVMVVVGLAVFASQFFDLGDFWGRIAIYILPVLGVIFLLWGIFKREDGFIIPGGILSGLGTGLVLITGPSPIVAGTASGGIFMLSFAMGFVAITLLTAVFTEETHWWALIPGGIMGLVGLTVLYGGIFEQLLSLLSYLWPLALIAGGIYIIYRVSRNRKQDA